MLGWKESFDLLLSSKSELCLLCLWVAHGWHMGTHVPQSQPEDAENVGKIIVIVIIIP